MGLRPLFSATARDLLSTVAAELLVCDGPMAVVKLQELSKDMKSSWRVVITQKFWYHALTKNTRSFRHTEFIKFHNEHTWRQLCFEFLVWRKQGKALIREINDINRDRRLTLQRGTGRRRHCEKVEVCEMAARLAEHPCSGTMLAGCVGVGSKVVLELRTLLGEVRFLIALAAVHARHQQQIGNQQQQQSGNEAMTEREARLARRQQGLPGSSTRNNRAIAGGGQDDPIVAD